MSLALGLPPTLLWLAPNMAPYWQKAMIVAFTLTFILGTCLLAVGLFRLTKPTRKLPNAFKNGWDKFWTAPKVIWTTVTAVLLVFAGPVAANRWLAPPVVEIARQTSNGVPNLPAPPATIPTGPAQTAPAASQQAAPSQAGTPELLPNGQPKSIITIEDGAKVKLSLTNNKVRLKGGTSLSSTPADMPVTAHNNDIEKDGTGTVFDVRPPTSRKP